MAFDTIGARDANGNVQAVAGKAETEGTSKFFQAFRLLFGASGSVPTLVSSIDPLPVTNTTKWSVLGSVATVVNGAGVAPTLKNLANSANKLGIEFDNTNSANRYQYADFELLCRGASAMTDGAVIKLWLLECFDGTNYEDGSDSVTPARPPDEQFIVRAVSTAQRLVVRGLLLPATKFTPLIRNESGVALTNTDAENLLRIRPYSEMRL